MAVPDPPRRGPRQGRQSRTAPRRNNSAGRRRSDNDPRTELTKKVLFVINVGVGAVYLVGEVIIFGVNNCL